ADARNDRELSLNTTLSNPMLAPNQFTAKGAKDAKGRISSIFRCDLCVLCGEMFPADAATWNPGPEYAAIIQSCQKTTCHGELLLYSRALRSRFAILVCSTGWWHVQNIALMFARRYARQAARLWKIHGPPMQRKFSRQNLIW